MCNDAQSRAGKPQRNDDMVYSITSVRVKYLSFTGNQWLALW